MTTLCCFHYMLKISDKIQYFSQNILQCNFLLFVWLIAMRNHGYAIYSNSWQSIRQTTSYYIKKRNNFYGTYVLSYSHIKIRWWCRSMNPPLRISDSLEVDIGLSSSIRLSNILFFFFFHSCIIYSVLRASKMMRGLPWRYMWPPNRIIAFHMIMNNLHITYNDFSI